MLCEPLSQVDCFTMHIPLDTSRQCIFHIYIVFTFIFLSKIYISKKMCKCVCRHVQLLMHYIIYKILVLIHSFLSTRYYSLEILFYSGFKLLKQTVSLRQWMSFFFFKWGTQTFQGTGCMQSTGTSVCFM